MAQTIKTPLPFESTGFKGIADASEIAYSYKTENGIEQIDKSVKDKIQDLETSGSSEVAERLDTLENNVSALRDLALDELTVRTYKESAASSAAQASQDKQTIQDYANSVLGRISSLESIAHDLQTSLIQDAEISVISEASYDQLTEQEKANRLFFIYSETTL